MLTVLGSLAGCAGESVEPEVVSTVAVTAPSGGSPALASIGETVQLTATPRNAGGGVVTGMGASWVSSNAAVARLSSASGVTTIVTAVGNGTAEITATAGGVSGKITVTVAQTVISVVVTPATNTLGSIGATVQLAAQAQDALGNPVAGKTPSWMSSNTAAVNVSGTGVATAVANGSVTITATVDGINGTAGVTVAQVASNIVVTPPTATLMALGTTQQFSAVAYDALGTQLVTPPPFTWTSSLTGVATINGATGLATATGNGTTTITATAPTVAGAGMGSPAATAANGTATLTVVQEVDHITVTPAAPTLGALGATQAFTAQAFDAQNQLLATQPTFTWASSATGVATVDPATGVATAVTNGTTTITASAPGAGGTVDGSATLTVAQALDHIVVAPADPTLSALGTTQQFSAQGRDANDNPLASPPTFAWSSSVTGVATIDPASGLATAAGNGTTTISASAPGGSGMVSGTTTLTVGQVATSVSVTPPTSTLVSLGGTVQLAASATDGNGNPVTGALVWLSSNALIASVDGAGLVTAVANGTVTITAQLGAASGTASVTVAQAIDHIVVSPASPTITSLGSVQQFTAQARDARDNPLATQPTFAWASSATGVATIDPATGLATTVADGSTTITASAPGGSGPVSGTATLTVQQAADATRSTASVPNGTAGTATTITITVLDGNDMPVTGVAADLALAVTGDNTATPAQPTDNGNGTYTTSYVPTAAGSDNVAITLGGTPISGSPYTSMVQAGAAASLEVTGIADPLDAGINADVIVTARDAQGNVAAGYAGTITFTSSDAGVGLALPADYTFVPGTDAGVHTFVGGVTLVTVGEQSVTATDNVTGSITGTQSAITVQAGGAVTLEVTGISDPFVAGASSDVAVTARDGLGNVAAGYAGTITFTSSDAGAGVALPASYTFVPGTDAGVHTFTAGVTLVTAGEQSVTATDDATGSITGTQTAISVQAGGAVSLDVTGISDPFAAGATSDVTVTARDALGNVAAGYAGTITFTSSDVGAGVALPAGYTFVPGTDAGTHTFTLGVTLVTAGEQTVTATDNATGSITGTQAAITVEAGGAVSLEVAGISDPFAAGATSDVTVTARDAQGNVAPGYAGTIAFTSSDAGAGVGLPATYTFVPGTDAGTHTFTDGVTLVTAGEQTVTATDDATGSITGTQSAITVQAGAAVRLDVTGISDPFVAGGPSNVVVTARDALGNVAAGYAGTITFTSSDVGVGVALPADYTFVPGPDAGTHTFALGVTLVTLGEQSVTATDNATGSITGTQTAITVQAGPAVTLDVTGISDPFTAGASSDVTVTARDAQGNVATAYTGTITFASSDAGVGVALPADYTFVPGTDAGVHTFTTGVTLVTAGEQSVTATDNATGSITGTQSAITVQAGPAVSLDVTGISDPFTAGASSTVTVTARDALGNVAAGYAGTIAFTSSDVGVGVALPADYTFVPGTDAGAHTFTNGVTLITMGEQSVTATDNATGSITGAQVAITVQAGPAVTLQVTGISDPFTAGSAADVTVTARDAQGNVATAYAGTITFTSSDGGVGVAVPANYTFVPGDAGVHTFTSGVTLVTAGEQTVTATDVVTGTITGTQSAITVQAGAAVSLSVTGITDPLTAGAPSNVVVTARDAQGNVAPSYAGTVAFTSSDAGVGVVLPANYTFVPGTDLGVHTFTGGVTLVTVGEQTVTATDNVTASITGTQAAVTVQAGPAVSLEVAGITDPLPFGAASDVTVTARDVVGNVATGYLGTVAFTSSDVGLGVVLPANYTFVPGDAGAHTFTGGVTLVTVGEQTVTATDNVTASITGTQSAITVTGGAAVILEVTGILDPIAPGQPSDVVVTAKDGLGNVAASYAGTVTFTSTDVDLGVVLPADYTFVPATDAGVHTFSAGVTLRTTGEQTVTATDNVTATITGTQAAITVQPGPIDHIVLTPTLATLTSLIAQQFTAVAEDAFNNPLNPQPLITWGSTAGGVATVDGSGLASAVGAGTTTISATVGAVSAQATLHVVLNLANILVTPASPTLTLLGTPQPFTAVARDAGNNALPVQPTFTWTSSDTTVAIVDATGQAGAGGNGGTTITVTVEGFGGIEGTATLTVNDPTAREILVANYDDDNLSVVDGSTNAVSTLGGVGGAPFGLALNGAGSTTYISALASNHIAVLDNAAKTFGTPILLAPGSGPVGVTTTPDGAYIAVTTPGTNSLTLIRTSDNQITTVPVSAEPYEVVAVSNTLIWITNGSPQGYITQYDIATTDTIKKEAGFYTGGIAEYNGVLVVAAGGSNAVLFHDAATGDQLDVLNAGDGIGIEPDGVAITSDGIAYVANVGSNTVSVIDVDSRALLTTVPVGNRPRGVTISPDGALVYVVNEGGDPGVVDDAYVSVISTQTNTVVARFTVGLQAKRAVAR